MLRSALPACVLIVLAACSSTGGEVGRRLLNPDREWLVDPATLVGDNQRFELEVSNGSITGWLLRADGADGRTVLLFHGGSTNASQTHPWCEFLRAAGFNVCVFDYRGYGKSRGEVSLLSAFYDAPAVLAWLQQQPGVDRERIAFYGLHIGSAIALRTAAREGSCKAIVLEEAPSLHTMLESQHREMAAVPSALSVGFAEFVHGPDHAEPDENAAELAMPSLWISGQALPAEDQRALLAAFVAMRGDKQLWMLPGTGPSPHSLMTHDGEYQRTVVRFLRSALDGTQDRVGVQWRLDRAADGGGDWWAIELQRQSSDQERWAVQICALEASGASCWQNAWLEGAQRTVKMKLPAAPGVVGAMRLQQVEPADAGVFAPTGTPLSRAGAWYQQHAAAFDLMRNGEPDVAAATAAAAAITARQQQEPLPPQLEAQLADVYYGIGRALTAPADGAQRAQGLDWLRRAVAARPAHPERHFWPGPQPTWGFPQADAVIAAQALLKRLGG